MKRYGRARYCAFGVLPALNAIGLLLHGLNLSTHGRGGAAAAVPLLAALAIACLAGTLPAAVHRGRDLGWPPWVTLAAFVVSLGMGPAVLIVIGYLACAATAAQGERFGPPGAPLGVVGALLSLAWLALPWLVFLAAARLL